MKSKQKSTLTPLLHRSSATTSVEASPKSRLTVKELKKKKIPLNVSEQLQNQIHFLCSEVDTDEWSGTLFYTVEGDLGEENFKINADYVYLQDIGTSTYTEYDPSNPEYIKFLMDNPQFLEMKQGHIHSHNTMSVFFSGTDTGELADEMCAKVAFKATETREVKSTVSFRTGNGELKTNEGSTTEEVDSVYAYDCDITIPDVVGESFDSRFQEVRKSTDEREKKAKEVAKQAKEISKGLEEKALGGWDGKDGYRQVGLYDDVRPTDKGAKGKKAKKYDDFPWNASDPVVQSRRVANKASEVKIGGRIDPNVYSFLVKLISRDFTCEDRLSIVLQKLNRELYIYEDDYTCDRSCNSSVYMDSLDGIIMDHYINAFQEDVHVAGYNRVLQSCIDILDNYIDTYPELISDLTDVLNMAMDD